MGERERERGREWRGREMRRGEIGVEELLATSAVSGLARSRCLGVVLLINSWQCCILCIYS